MSTKQQSSKSPRHQFERKFLDSYELDIAVLGQISELVRSHTDAEITYSLTLTGGHIISDTDLARLAASPVLNMKPIEEVALRTHPFDGFYFDLTLGELASMNTMSLSARGDSAAFDGFLGQVEQLVQQRKTWYSAAMRPTTSFVLFFVTAISLTLFVAFVWPEYRMSPLPYVTSALGTLAVYRCCRFLFKRIEFTHGQSGREAAMRRQWRKFIGGGLAVPIAIAIGVSWGGY